MKTSEKIELISAALVAMQGEAEHANFDSKNPHFKSKYASLAEVIDTVKPILARHELAVIQLPGYREGIGHVLCTRILHTSGQWIEEEMKLNPIKDDPQGLGSSLTYSRRYSIPGVAMIASEEDDDGNAASHAPNVTPVQARAVTKEQVLKHLNSLNAEDDIRKFFPSAITRLGFMKGSYEYSEIVKEFTRRTNEVKPAANEEAKAA